MPCCPPPCPPACPGVGEGELALALALALVSPQISIWEAIFRRQQAKRAQPGTCTERHRERAPSPSRACPEEYPLSLYRSHGRILDERFSRPAGPSQGYGKTSDWNQP
jgi:hypothetical protein